MKVSVIGAGNMARGIAMRALSGGNEVQIIGRDFEQASALAGELRSMANGGKVSASPPGDDLAGSLVVLAVPYRAAVSVVTDYSKQLAGKVIIDITNPLNDTYDGLLTPSGQSAAEQIAEAAPDDALVVKAFNTAFANTLVEGRVAGQPLDIFIAGDDSAAKSAVADLAESGGLRPIDSGPLSHARQLEDLTLLHIMLQSTMNTGFMSAVKIVS